MNDNQHAIDNAKAWFESIREMVAAVNEEDEDSNDREREARYDAAIQAILKSQVRSGWYSPGARAPNAPRLAPSSPPSPSPEKLEP